MIRAIVHTIGWILLGVALTLAIEWLRWEPPGADDQYRKRITAVRR